MKIQIVIVLFFLTSAAHAQEVIQKVDKYYGNGSADYPKLIMDVSWENLENVPNKANDGRIKILILDNNKINRLPNFISVLTDLRELSVRDNN